MTESNQVCIACKVDAGSYLPSTAFLAGIAFTVQHNDEAIRKRLCPAHGEILVRGHMSSRAVVPAEDRRERVENRSDKPR